MCIVGARGITQWMRAYALCRIPRFDLWHHMAPWARTEPGVSPEHHPVCPPSPKAPYGSPRKALGILFYLGIINKAFTIFKMYGWHPKETWKSATTNLLVSSIAYSETLLLSFCWLSDKRINKLSSFNQLIISSTITRSSGLGKRGNTDRKYSGICQYGWFMSTATLGCKIIQYLFKFLSSFILGHTQLCSRFPHSSVLRDNSNQCSGNHMHTGDQPGLPTYKASAWLTVLSLQPFQHLSGTSLSMTSICLVSELSPGITPLIPLPIQGPTFLNLIPLTLHHSELLCEIKIT